MKKIMLPKVGKLMVFCMMTGIFLCNENIRASELKVTALRCEYRVNPLGVGESHPRLTWEVLPASEDLRGAEISAWQVLVAADRELLDKGENLLWDSGRVKGLGLRTVYDGKKLEFGDQAWWRVRVWDGKGQVSEWSEAATWSRGMIDTRNLGEWVGTWIGLDPQPHMIAGNLTNEQRNRARNREVKWMQAQMSAVKQRPIPDFDKTQGLQIPPSDNIMPAKEPLTAYFRKFFKLSSEVESAVIWVVPDMRCEIWVNGSLAGTANHWDIAGQVSIAHLLRTGENVIALKVTQDDGYAPSVCGEVEIVQTNGKSMRMISDKSWLYSETEQQGWAEVGFDSKAWEKPEEMRSPPRGGWENATQAYAPASYLRKEFTVREKLKKATVYATALGIYELELNGEKVGDAYFAPGWTDYLRRLHVQAYDVTDILREGKNAVGIVLGDGWFAGVLGHVGKKYSYEGYPRARMMLVMEHEDGSVERLGTDRSWKANFGAIRYADLMQGCVYDRRLEWEGWSGAGFNDDKWQRVRTGLRSYREGGPPPLPRAVIEGASLDGVRQMEELAALSVKESAPGVWVVDFGQNFVGWVKMRARGKPGQKITLRHAEILNPNGSIYTTNLRGAAAADVFWLNGEGDEILEPRFTFHGFRYAEVRGLDYAPSLGDFKGLVVHTPMERSGWFECSDERINKLFSNIIWGQRGNYLEIPTDCPQRDERLGWSGDVQFFARTAAFNYDIVSFMERWLVTMIEDSQSADGTFADVSPMVPARRGRPSTAWGDAAILCTHMLWQQYGETRGIERHYAAMSGYIDWLEDRSRNGIVFVGGYGDWLHKGGTAKTEVMDTAYYAYLCQLMAEMGEAIGRDREAGRFRKLNREVKDAFAKAFLDGEGRILESSQTGYALAFTMDLLPEVLKVKAAERFRESMQAFDWHLATGFIGTPRLLPGLFEAGLEETAYRVLLQDTYPSWLYQVKLGATTMWERWDGWTPEGSFQSTKMNSFNHYSFGAVAESFYRHILGIETDGPGFRKIIINPHVNGDLRYARGAYHAVTGRIVCAWEKAEDGSFLLSVRIPVGVTAKIYLPTEDENMVSESGSRLRDLEGIKILPKEKGKTVMEVPSGRYSFRVLPVK